MIVYTLVCSEEHEFEIWFRDSAAYEDQKAAGDIACPVCGDTAVTKAIMAPNVSSSRKRESRMPMVATEAESLPQAGGGRPDGSHHMGNRAAMEMLRAFHKHLKENCEDVGDRFPEEARKIHHGESEQRGIYGEATDEEAQELIEEGIAVGRIPKLRHDS
ncbi:MAG: DUF1178 family protein [Alphaproteobacteria bacterium]